MTNAGQRTVISSSISSYWNCPNHVGCCGESIGMADFRRAPQQFHSHTHVHILLAQNHLPKYGNSAGQVLDLGPNYAVLYWDYVQCRCLAVGWELWFSIVTIFLALLASLRIRIDCPLSCLCTTQIFCWCAQKDKGNMNLIWMQIHCRYAVSRGSSSSTELMAHSLLDHHGRRGYQIVIYL